LVRDTDGLTIVDIDDDFDLTYSSVQKGGAAERYERVLHSLDHDVAKSDDECDVEVVETPELGASALVATIGGSRRVYALTSRGRLDLGQRVTEDEFYAVVLQPSPPPERQPKRGADDEFVI
jgi:hypothetical protein